MKRTFWVVWLLLLAGSVEAGMVLIAVAEEVPAAGSKVVAPTRTRVLDSVFGYCFDQGLVVSDEFWGSPPAPDPRTRMEAEGRSVGADRVIYLGLHWRPEGDQQYALDRVDLRVLVVGKKEWERKEILKPRWVVPSPEAAPELTDLSKAIVEQIRKGL